MKHTVIDCNRKQFSMIQNITITKKFRNHNQLQLHNCAVINYNYIIGPSSELIYFHISGVYMFKSYSCQLEKGIFCTEI